jgi:hypothetical protein
VSLNPVKELTLKNYQFLFQITRKKHLIYSKLKIVLKYLFR